MTTETTTRVKIDLQRFAAEESGIDFDAIEASAAARLEGADLGAGAEPEGQPGAEPGTQGGASFEGQTEPGAGGATSEQQPQHPQYTYWDPAAESAANTLFKIRHGDKEIDLTWDDIKDLAEKGFDYTQKRQRDADALRWAEENRPKFQAYEALGERLRQDQELATVIAAMDNPQFRAFLRQSGIFGTAAHGGRATQAGATGGYDPAVAALQQQVQQLQSQLQQHQLTAQQEEQLTHLRSQWEQIKAEYPSLFSGALATRNQLRLQQAAQELAEQGILDLNYALHKAFGPELSKAQKTQAVSNYVKQKTQGQGPAVQGGGGSPAAAVRPKAKNPDDLFDLAEKAAAERFAQAERT